MLKGTYIGMTLKWTMYWRLHPSYNGLASASSHVLHGTTFVGFAFIEFEDPRDAEESVKDMDGRRVCGMKIRVEIAKAENKLVPVKTGSWLIFITIFYRSRDERFRDRRSPRRRYFITLCHCGLTGLSYSNNIIIMSVLLYRNPYPSNNLYFNCTHHLSSVTSFNQGLHSSLPLFLHQPAWLQACSVCRALSLPAFLHVKVPSANHYSCATCCRQPSSPPNGLRWVTTPSYLSCY